jgi:hypothetical protein
MAVVKSIEIDIGVKGDAASKAKLDEITRRAEELKKAFPTYSLKIDSAAASERLRVFKAQLADATKDRTANVKVKVDDSALQKFANSMKGGGGPAWLGPALALTPAAGTLTGVAAGAAAGLGGAAVAGAAALAAFGAVAKPVLASALTAEQAVNAAQNTYTATIAAGVPKAQAQLSLQTANSNAMLTYSAALKGGAKPATALAAYHVTLAKNQLAYNSATNAGVFQAKAYAAEQAAIGKAYADLSPQQVALSKQLGSMANAWQNLKAAETPVVAGALQPWLQSVTSLTGKLPPVISAVAPVIGDLGNAMNNVVTSPAFITFRNFIANQGSYAVLTTGGALIDFFDAFIILLPKFTPLITMASNGIGDLGQKVLNWSQSAKASQDITRFMDWFRVNGPVVGGLLKNIGGTLKALAPGLTAGGITELRLLSDFFGWVAKLPPSVAKPLAEVAGTLLVLNKLGVFSVGVKFVGKAASWLTNGVVSIGSGASAAAEMQAAMTAGGASAAAEIRAAMAAGGTAAGAELGAGEAAGGASAAGAVVTAEKAAAPAIGTLIGLAVAAQVGGYLAEKQFSNMFSAGVKAASSPGKEGAALSSVLAGTGTDVTLHVNVATNTRALDALLKELGYTPYAIGLVNKAVVKPGANVGDIDKVLYSLGFTQSDILAVNKMIVKPKSDTSKIDALLTRIGLTPGEIDNVDKLIAKPGSSTAQIDRLLHQIGLTPPQVAAANKLILKPRSDTSPVTGLQKAIDALHGKTVNVATNLTGEGGLVASATGVATKFFNLTTIPKALGGLIKGGIPGRDSVLGALMPGEVVVPTAMVNAGAVDHLRGKLPGFAGGGLVSAAPWAGTQAAADVASWAAGDVRGWANAAIQRYGASTAAAGKAGSGVQRWRSLVLQALGMEHLNLGYVNDVLYQMQTESGGNPNAINLTDINAQLGDPSRGLMQVIGATFAMWHWPGTSGNIFNPLANIAAALNYAQHGKGFGPGMGQIGSGHGYALGTMSAAPGWARVGEHGPEWLRFRGGEQVLPAGTVPRGGDVHYHVTVNVPPTVNPREAGREVANLLLAHTKTGGRLYPPGTAPR